MVNYSAVLDRTFGALSDPTRRAILAHLAEAPDASVSDLARPFRISAPAISRHLRVLEGAGLLTRRREGRVHHLRLLPAPLESANDWLDRYRRFWEGKLDALERYLRESQKEEDSWPPPPRHPHPPAPRRRSASRARSRPRAKGSSAPGPTRRS
jgi:DNA-binding transcriptional ArsR family regulator